MRSHVDIAIVGAGPFGLSIAAHLRGRGRSFRIFGNPMESWRTRMPKGMQLKSAGFSSTICAPGRDFTLRDFCQERGIPYRDVGLPVRLDTFSAYGLEFQQRFVPDLETVRVAMLEQCPEGFALQLDNGDALTARKVVLAVGVDYFRHIPEALIHLPTSRCSHSAEHHELDRFRGQHVTLLGAGASAFDLAVLLREAGATPLVIARRRMVKFNPHEPLKRGLRETVLRPMSGVGPGWKQRICTDLMPQIYRYLSDDYRVRTVKEFLGPSVGWFMREQAMSVPLLLGQEMTETELTGDRILLQLRSIDGKQQSVETDHVIAATGYRNDVRRLPFLSPVILEQLQLLELAPRLSAHFESSVAGLYFAGPISATSFGPVMRFAYGAKFTAPRIIRHLAA